MEVDYTLEILGEKIIYKPREELLEPITNSENRIFEIRAENGYGKTFLLNLLAYAFNAERLDNDQLIRTLRESIDRYNDNRHYSLNYEISLTLPNKKKLLLQKEKGKERIIKFIGESAISPEEIQKSIYLLYDVPTDPSERLDAVIKNLGPWNDNLLKHIDRYYQYLRETERNFTNVKDENKIKEYLKKDEELKIHIEKLNYALNHDLKIQLKKYEQLKLLDRLVNLQKAKGNYEKEKVKIEVELNEIDRPTNTAKRDESKIISFQSHCEKLEKRFYEKIRIIKVVIAENNEINALVENNRVFNKHYTNIQQTDLKKWITDNYIESMHEFNNSLQILTDGISKYITREEQSNKYLIRSFLEGLLDYIDRLIDNDAEKILEEITTQKTDFLKKQIKKTLSEYKLKDYKVIKEKLSAELDSNSFRNILKEYWDTRKSLKAEKRKQLSNPNETKYYELRSNFKELDKRIQSTLSEFTLIREKLSDNMDIGLSQTKTINEILNVIGILKSNIFNKSKLSNIQVTIAEIQAQIKSTVIDIENLTNERNVNKAKLDLEKQKKESAFSDADQEKIRGWIKKLAIIKLNLSQFQKLIREYNQGNRANITSEVDQQFMIVAGKVIAHSMDNKVLRPDGHFIGFDFYDMIKKEFRCENDIIIKKEDISTGLASANYLRQRISNVEGKYVIVLLDEIGNMTSNTLEMVVEPIKNLEKNNKLILALLTKPSENGKNIEVIPR